MKLVTELNLLAWLAVSLAGATPHHVSYDGFKVFRIEARGSSESVRESLSSLAYDEWGYVPKSHIDIAISPDQVNTFEALGLKYSPMHEDLGASIAAESARNSQWKRQADDPAWFDSYHSYAEHQQYWEDLQALFPNNSERISSGTSFEGRDLFGLHFWGASGPGKPAILWHSTVHAREWITTMVVEYLTLNLITGYETDEQVRTFLDSYDFYVIPFVNPDGFVYTQTIERLWRKNRQPGPGNSTCYGRDINRNWPYMWDGNPLGASDDPCDQTYHGEAPADSPEGQGLAKLVDDIRDSNGIKLYIDWHSYGQLIEFPFGYDCTRFPEDAGKLTKLATLTSEAIRDVEGTTFTFGQACSTLYPTEGGSRDHIYVVGEAQWSYTIELRDTGEFGFVLPPEQIIGSAKEQWEGIKIALSLLDEVFFDGEGPA